ncbi:MAG: nucleotidyltransferase domain-containing protein [Usitatibacteraceae bacterium]
MKPFVPTTLSQEQRAFIDRAIAVLSADARVMGVAAAGSYATDTMDQFSDIDLVVAVDPAHEAEIRKERHEIAARIGNLLAGFTGEHVGEPRLLICLYGSPLLHVDLKFVALGDAGKRVDEPVVLSERGSRLTESLAREGAAYPGPEMQWVEDRFWVWLHYVAAKIGRGEFFEALDFLSFLRTSVLGPLGLRALGLRPSGVRRIEAIAPSLADELKATVAVLEAESLLAAVRASVATYRRLRSASATPVDCRTAAEAAAMGYLEEIEAACACRP